MAYDELELDRIGDRKTVVFFIISDTTQTYNFLVALAFSQMFNLLCERADNVHGGRLPHHVRVLWDEAANTGQVPQLEKIVAVIRSREISLTLFYQQLAQCKAIYDKHAETILGNMDSVIFLGGREASTIKEISENWLGKATISMQTDSRSRGQSESYSQNNQRLGRELMTPSELATMPGDREGGTMARTKNRGLQQSFSPSYTVRRWRLGEYIRLSKEDLKKGKDDSNSVINQRDLLNDFYQKHIGEFESVSEYVDDGHTGTDANRENFQRLLSDVMSGKINCVVVKDLSRFARNYSDAGSLIDNLFVQMGVRFISLAENVDSYLNPDSVSSIIVPITNVMNDQYCYQTSKKIRQVFDYKRRNGQYIGAFAPYGYVKYPKDKHQLIIDPDAAEIVKLIFSLFLKGTSKRAIALYLNEHGVPSPSAYKLQKGIPVSTRGYDDPMWGARMIHSILTNPTYTGDLAQGRSRVKSYKVHEVESVPREEWVEVAGTHESIIDYETFDKVQALLQRDTRTSPKGREVHLFSGFLKCADCGRAITRSVGNNNNVYYACSTYKNRSRTACTMHSIKHNRLEAAVLFAVQQQIHLAVSYSEMIARINTAPVKKSQSIRLEELIAAKERELAKISRYKQSLYQDWKDGEITQQDYRDMKADYERQTIALTDVLAQLNAERAELANGVKSEHPALVAFTKHQNIDQLSRELLVELIDHIKVYENGNISVRFKFADEFRRIAEYIEINTTKPAVAG